MKAFSQVFFEGTKLKRACYSQAFTPLEHVGIVLFIIIFGKILLLFARLNIICLQYVGNESPVVRGTLT